MRLQASSITGQCHVDEVLVVAKILESWRYATLVVVPSQAEVLSIHHLASVVVVIILLERDKKKIWYQLSCLRLHHGWVMTIMEIAIRNMTQRVINHLERFCWLDVVEKIVFTRSELPNVGTARYRLLNCILARKLELRLGATWRRCMCRRNCLVPGANRIG